MIDAATCNATNTSGCDQTPPVLAVGSGPGLLAIDKATNTIYVPNGNDGTVSVIDGATCNATNTSECPPFAPTTEVGNLPQPIAVDLATNTVYWRVELPFAFAADLRGCPHRHRDRYVVAIATLATFAGGGGLVDIIVNEPTYGTAGVIAGSLTITLLAFSVDGALALMQYAVTPRPLRKLGRDVRVDAVVEHTWGTGDRR